jgi:hypothetical protein
MQAVKRQRIAAICDVAAFLALGLLFYGWAFYPSLGVPMAIANIVFIVALAVAWIIGRLSGRR